VIEIPIGSQQTLQAGEVASFSEGTRGVVDIRLTPEGNQFILVGLRVGRTTLLTLDHAGQERLYQISVVDPASGGPTRPTVDYGPGTVSPRANVRLDVFFVQLSEDYNHQVGLSWPTSLGPAPFEASVNLKTGQLVDASAVVAGEILPRLDLAQARGWAKTLRKAAVVTANGTEATFSGGGEVNVPVLTGLGGSLQQVSFGSLVRVRPRYDPLSGRIELSVTADVSDLASDHGTGVPGRSTAKLVSVVNLELGQSLALAGLTSESQARDHAGIPWLSQIPIVGGLFGTHGDQLERVRNVMFIVPTVIDAIPARKRDAIRRALEAYRAYDGDLEDVQLLEVQP